MRLLRTPHAGRVGARCLVILEKKHKLAFDWAWEKGRSREQRAHARGSLSEGDYTPWKFYVNQITGERIVSPTR